MQKFLRRHSQLINKYVSTLNKNRVMIQHSAILKKWFDLFQKHRILYDVKNDNIYNMNEKSFLQDIIVKLRIIIDKHDVNQSSTQLDNKKWTFFIECVFMTNRKLRSWIIFKKILLQKTWIDVYEEIHFTCTKNDWINNEINLLWLQRCFDVKTVIDEYRILCVNEHVSHISTKVIQFCVDKKIILLCLSAHIIHILQSLNVEIFESLATIYKNILQLTTKFEADFSIDKNDFLKILKLVRTKSLTKKNIQKIWKKTDLEFYDSKSILHKYRDRENSVITTKLFKKHYFIIVITSSDSSVEVIVICKFSDDRIRIVFMILHNDEQMRKFLKQIVNMFENVVEIIKKINKFVVHVFANATFLNDQTKQLMTLIFKKKFKKKRQKDVFSDAKVMNQKMLDEKRLHWNWNIAFKKLNDIHLNVCERKKMKFYEKRKVRWNKTMIKKDVTSKKSRFFKKIKSSKKKFKSKQIFFKVFNVFKKRRF